jgi:hypothetical protein
MSGESEEIDAGEALDRLNTLFRESAEASREIPIEAIVEAVLQEHADDDIKDLMVRVLESQVPDTPITNSTIVASLMRFHKWRVEQA